MTNNDKSKSTRKPTKWAKPRVKTKVQTILRLLNRPTGATLAELSKGH